MKKRVKGTGRSVPVHIRLKKEEYESAVASAGALGYKNISEFIRDAIKKIGLKGR